jgi:hypothetical protein
MVIVNELIKRKGIVNTFGHGDEDDSGIHEIDYGSVSRENPEEPTLRIDIRVDPWETNPRQLTTVFVREQETFIVDLGNVKRFLFVDANPWIVTNVSEVAIKDGRASLSMVADLVDCMEIDRSSHDVDVNALEYMRSFTRLRVGDDDWARLGPECK